MMDYQIAEQIAEQIEAIQASKTLDELLSIVERNTKALGFDYFSYGHRSHTPISAPKLDLISNYPDKWQADYNEKQYFHQDPTILHALKTTAPLIWSENTFSDSVSLREDAASYGIEYGWSQATRNTTGLSMLTLVRSSDPLSKSELKDKTPNLMWFTQVLNSALENYINSGSVNIPEITLTTREAEVLRWTADGKTSYEISIILGISERTVNFHLNNVMAKLNSNNKISATVKALALSLI